MRMNRRARTPTGWPKPARPPKIVGAHPTLFEDAEQRRIYEEQCAYPGGIFCWILRASGGLRFSAQLEDRAQCRSLGEWRRWCAIRNPPHSGMSAQELDEAGIGDGLVRVSVGIEDWRDLLADFEQALEA